ncbi:MAG TPA: undecaprenyl-diphosphate phosphatase [Balneolales bacterium]|nr:undecaprenyl-diphosphate phosphatase [Balneolales bacterium]
MSVIQSIILGIVEGLTEFLPVSSTGHMIIASSVMGIVENPYTKAFTVAIQFGAILSVIVLYWRRFIKSMQFYYKLFVAFLPAAIVGLILIKYINEMLGSVLVVATMLFLGGIVLLFVDDWFSESEKTPDKEVTYKNAFVVGLFQIISMIPGTSRSAATIIGGLEQKLNRKTAAEFSFFLAVPTMFAATCFKIFRFYMNGPGFNNSQIDILIIGNIVAFFVAMLAIKSFIEYLTKHGFKLFGWYRIAIGLLILILHFSGVTLKMM